MPSVCLRGRERSQQVRPVCLVRIYWRLHVEDWCVVTWHDCTWSGWGCSFQPPHPPDEIVHAHTPFFLRGLTWNASSKRWQYIRGRCSHEWFDLTWWQGVFPVGPPSIVWVVHACYHRHLKLAGHYLTRRGFISMITAISKLNFKHTYLKF
jgi:hypothetical protein